MMIRELSSDETGLINEISELHLVAFPEFFLTQLGLPFLKTLYRGYLDDKDSGIIAAEDKRRVIGFIAYSNDYPRFFKNMIKHRIIQFAGCAFLAAVRHPSFVGRLLKAFGKSKSVTKDVPYVELASICVDPSLKGRGIGSKLIDYLKSVTDFKTYACISLETDADNNDSANRFYIKNGFQLNHTYTTAEGRRMNEYFYAPGASE